MRTDNHWRKLKAAELKKARESANFRSAAEAARHFSWNPNTYRSHENGYRDFDYDDAKRYADARSNATSLLS